MAPMVMRGRVTRMEGRRPHVEVPQLGDGFSFGPLQTATAFDLAVGDQVLVVAANGIPEDLIVVAQLDPGSSLRVVRLTAAEYAAISVPDDSVLYVIVG